MMAKERLDGSLITSVDVKEYFRDSVTAVLSRQKVDAGEDTVYYIVNLLAYFTHADRLFTHTPEGVFMEPLALMYAEAVEAANAEERQQLLRRLGDVALLISGLFESSLSRKLVDVDYYIAMGGTAYGYLSDLNRNTLRGRALGAIFGELSRKFQVFVDVLAEVGEKSRLGSSTDVMRLYEIWLKTGSKRTAERLRQLGIEPVRGAGGSRHN